MHHFDRLIMGYIIVLFIGCDWPFNTKVSEGDIFVLTIKSDIDRVMPNEEIYLSWNEITVDGSFDKYLIERKQTGDDDWELITEIADRFILSYIDTIDDDEDLYYRVGMNTEEGNIIWAQEFVEIPNTDSIRIPSEFEQIMNAVRSPLVDDNDVVLVGPGEYVENLFILGKDIILKATEGREHTLLIGNGNNVVISMNNSVVDGFDITNGINRRDGGGVLIQGDGVVLNCYIHNNFSEGDGGGVCVKGNGSIYNSIIVDNSALFDGDGIFINDGHGEIINNTIIRNDVVIDGNCENLLLRNNIFFYSAPDISFIDQSDQDSVIVDYSRFDFELPFASNSITNNPLFIDLDDFEFSKNSPCSDAGHPDEQYNDIDGSRNDMGAYGGPVR